MAFGLIALSGLRIEINEVQVRLNKVGVVRQGLFVLLDRFEHPALELQAKRLHFARARVGPEGMDVAHQRIVDRWLAARGAFRLGHMAACRGRIT